MREKICTGWQNFPSDELVETGAKKSDSARFSQILGGFQFEVEIGVPNNPNKPIIIA